MATPRSLASVASLLLSGSFSAHGPPSDQFTPKAETPSPAQQKPFVVPSAASPRSKRRIHRKLKKLFYICFFAAIANRVCLESRWSRYAKRINTLLEAEAEQLPAFYFHWLTHPEKCTLLPANVSQCLPQELLQQIRSFAKNVIARLFTPIAKLYGTRRRVRKLVAQYEKQSEPIDTEALKTYSSFFSHWPDEALQQLLRLGRYRAYLPGMWLLPPAVDGAFAGVFLLEGSLVASQSDERKIERTVTAPCVFAEIRQMAHDPSKESYRALTNCFCFEFDWRDIAQCFRSIPPQQMPEAHNFLIAERQRLLNKQFRLTVEDLRAHEFFAEWEDAELMHLLPVMRPRVFLESALVLVQGQAVDEIFFVSRGSAGIFVDNAKIGELRRGCTFADAAAICEEKVLFTVRTCDYLDVWSVTKREVYQQVRSPSQQKIVEKAVVKSKLKFMKALRNNEFLVGQLIDCCDTFFHLDALCAQNRLPSLTHILGPLLGPQVYVAGDRMGTAGDEILSLSLITVGRINQSTPAGYQALQVPCVLGSVRPRKEKWNHSVTAVRYTECWSIRRKDLFRALKTFPLLFDAFLTRSSATDAQVHNKRVEVAAASASSPGRWNDTATSLGRTNYAHTVTTCHPPPLSCGRRAEAWQRIHSARELRECRAQNRAAAEAERHHREYAPICNHPSLAQLENIRPIEVPSKKPFLALRNVQPDGVHLKAVGQFNHHVPHRPVTASASVPLSARSLARSMHSLGATAHTTLDVKSATREVACKSDNTGLEFAPVMTESERADVRKRIQYELNSEMRRQSGLAESLRLLSQRNLKSVAHIIRRKSIKEAPKEGVVSAAEGKVLKWIFRRHKLTVDKCRGNVESVCTIKHMVDINPFSNFHVHRSRIPKMNRNGDLYVESRASLEHFDSKKHHQFVPPCLVSAHGLE